MLFFFDDCSDVNAGAAATIVDPIGNVDIVETDDVAATSEKELLSGLVTWCQRYKFLSLRNR